MILVNSFQLKIDSMKNLITAILVCISFNLFSQAEDDNFYLVDSKISWHKTYKTNKTLEQVLAYFEESDIFKKVKIENNQVFGQLNPHATNPKITGVPGVHPLVNKTDFKGDVNIQYRSKEKEYVVYFTNLTQVGRGDLLKKNEEQTFEQNFLKAGISEYRPYFLKRNKTVYNETFIPIFEIK